LGAVRAATISASATAQWEKLVAAESTELPKHQCNARLDRLQTRGEARSVITAARRKVFIDPSGIEASRQHGVLLRGQGLGPV
jgi:hypothetical protein